MRTMSLPFNNMYPKAQNLSRPVRCFLKIQKSRGWKSFDKSFYCNTWKLGDNVVVFRKSLSLLWEILGMGIVCHNEDVGRLGTLKTS